MCQSHMYQRRRESVYTADSLLRGWIVASVSLDLSDQLLKSNLFAVVKADGAAELKAVFF